MEEVIVINPKKLGTSHKSIQEEISLGSPYVEQISTEKNNHEFVPQIKNPQKKKAMYLPFLIIIPVMIFLLVLGIAYWKISEMVKDDVDEQTVQELPEEDGNVEDLPNEIIENVELDLSKITDSLREIDDAIFDIDVTVELIDESLAKDDDTPQL